MTLSHRMTGYAVASAAIAASILAYRLLKRISQEIPTEWEGIGTLKSIYFYPLKSGAPLDVESVFCAEVGLMTLEDTGESNRTQLRDRSFLIFNEKHKEFKTARHYPKIMLIKLTPYDRNTVALDAPAMETIYVKIPADEIQTKCITLFEKETVLTVDCGQEVATWLSKFLLNEDFGLRLGYNDGSLKRDIEKYYKAFTRYYADFTNQAGGLYSDLVSVSVINQASIDDCNSRIGDTTITAANYRNNLLVTGPGLRPFDEDHWDFIKVGGVVLKNVKECVRCQMPTIDPKTAVKHPKGEPFKTLNTFRMCTGPEKGSPMMGVYCAVRKTGQLKVGDTVYVSRK
ncbi:mitochondrial amidoxime reducing component 2-like isoform X2 [Cylas formicarius]|uniref:mitochondrial amidoxime reducing component 2-like isoform X2 n=1 Tax=Cylas formicarius TaxID=197179 RepID=UPI002958578A|nr:mitochondrial amidoxime reducing component 2-like isoform X2 [Cylas formicarius]